MYRGWNIIECYRTCWKRDDVMEGVRVLWNDVDGMSPLLTMQNTTKEAAYGVTTDITNDIVEGVPVPPFKDQSPDDPKNCLQASVISSRVVWSERYNHSCRRVKLRSSASYSNS